MLKRCIQAENRKLHASPIWVLFFALRSFQQSVEPSIICRIWKSSKMAGTVSGHSIHCFIRCFSFRQWWLLMQLICGDWNILDITGISLWQVRSDQ